MRTHADAGLRGARNAETPGPRPFTEDHPTGEPTLVAMKATGLTLERVDLRKGAQELDRRGASVRLSQSGDGGIACTVETYLGSSDQYEDHRAELAFIRCDVPCPDSAQQSRGHWSCAFQVNGVKRRLKWVRHTDAIFRSIWQADNRLPRLEHHPARSKCVRRRAPRSTPRGMPSSMSDPFALVPGSGSSSISLTCHGRMIKAPFAEHENGGPL